MSHRRRIPANGSPTDPPSLSVPKPRDEPLEATKLQAQYHQPRVLLSFACRTLPVLLIDLLRFALAIVVKAPGFFRFAWYYWVASNRETVAYGNASCRQRLDVYHSSRSTGRKRVELKNDLGPVVVFFPTGAWMVGYKMWGTLLARSLLRAGKCTVVMADYRNYPVGTVPDQLNDVKDALTWTMNNIHRYGGDKSRIVLAGESAGGHLLMLLLLRTVLLRKTQQTETVTNSAVESAVVDISNIKGLITVASPLNFSGLSDTFERHGLYREVLHLIFGGQLDESDPMQLILSLDGDRVDSESLRKHFPPVLICQGTGDATVPWQGSRAFAQTLREHGVAVDWQVYSGWTHMQANMEGPMEGDYRFHRDVWNAVQQWTRDNNDTAASSAPERTTKVEEEEEDVAVWKELGHLCPRPLVRLGSFVMPV